MNNVFWYLVLFFLSTNKPQCSEAHSFMLSPKGDFKSFKKGECRMGGPPHSPNDSCPGPCIALDSWQVDQKQPFSVYRRGETVPMVWAKNNHKGGFIRFSLVPRNRRMNAEAHASMTFRYGCYVSDEHDCGNRRCGTDRDSKAYRTQVEIPTSYPDGEYILGWAWYGGTVQRKSIFGDYYSCSAVRIRGGPLTASYEPKFIPGEKLNGSSTCLSAVNRLGICLREPCVGRDEEKMVPFNFRKGQKPRPILVSWFKKGVPAAVSVSPSPSTVPDKEVWPVRVTGMVMINAETGVPITASFRTVYLGKRDQRITFVALTTGDVEVVNFYLNDKWVRAEKLKPFSFWGDTEANYNAWPNPIYGRWISIRAEARGQDGTKHHRTFWLYLRRRRDVK